MKRNLILIATIFTLLSLQPAYASGYKPRFLAPHHLMLNDIGRQVMLQVSRSGLIVKDPLVNSYIQLIGSRLSQYSDIKHVDLSFYVYNDNRINAMAVPGGYIITYGGIFKNAQTESELAGVLAHEIAHIRQEHTWQNIQRRKQQTVPLIASGVAAVLLGMINPALGSGVLMAGTAGIAQAELSYSRAQERESDNLGLNMMYQANFDPKGMVDFFKQLHNEARYYDIDNVPPMLMTHPLSTERIADAESRLPEFADKSFIDSIDFQLIKNYLAVLNEKDANRAVNYANNAWQADRKSVAKQFALAAAYLKARQFKLAEKMLTPLTVAYPDNRYVQLLQAKIYLDTNQYQKALSVLSSIQQLFSDDQALLYFYTEQEIQHGNPDIAIKLLRSASIDHPERSGYHSYLARAYEVKGNPSQAYFHLAKALELEGEDKLAEKFEKRAERQPREDNNAKTQITH